MCRRGLSAAEVLQIVQDILDNASGGVGNGNYADHCNNADRDVARSAHEYSTQEAQGNQKYDLANWRYAELRDTINTSCDAELLKACTIEVCRREEIYCLWKAKNKMRANLYNNQGASSFMLEEVNKSGHVPMNNATQRYFRIPFERPAADGLSGLGEKRGWWYTHFDGQQIAREMEVHPGKPAILLTAGTDDKQMCELRLDETGFTRTGSAEILEQEFNHQWKMNGGKPYVRPKKK